MKSSNREFKDLLWRTITFFLIINNTRLLITFMYFHLFPIAFQLSMWIYFFHQSVYNIREIIQH